MSKVSKIFISLSFAFIVAFSFMFTNLQPLFAKADTISNYNVSFIAPDNSLLYDVKDIPSGYSLQDLEDSNYLQNPLFLDYTYNGTTYSFDNWVKYSSNLVLTPGDNILCVNNSESSPVNIQQKLDFNVGVATVTFIVCDDLNNLSYRTYSIDSDNHTSSSISQSNNISAIHYLDCFFGTSGQFQVNVYIKKESSVNIKYCSLVLGSIPLPYFNSSYLSDLLSEYNFLNRYYFYNVNYFDLITSDKYYYPDSYVIDSDWIPKIWGNLSYFLGTEVWTDGNNIYYSNGFSHYVLDVSSNSWISKTWYGLSDFNGSNIWTDGNYYYYSYGPNQYILDVSSSTWSQKSWAFSGEYIIESDFNGSNIWTDGNNYYLSTGNQNFVLNSSTSVWTKKVWSGYTGIQGEDIWTDGVNYYYSWHNYQYLIDISNSNIISKTWYGGSSYFEGKYVWTDGNNIYYSDGYDQFYLDVSSSTWSQKSWTGVINLNGKYVWTDGNYYYYSYGSEQFVLGNTSIIDNNYFYNNGYNNGFTFGYNSGYKGGYNNGYNRGIEEAGNYTFFSLISAVMDAPLKVFYGLFNFELMGVNLAGFIQALLSLAILLFIIRFALQK